MNRILFLRQQRRMNQYEFAEFCDISRASVARYDAGARVDRKNAEKIAAACGVSVDYILGFGPDFIDQSNISIMRGAVPIVGEIACGNPITAEQNIEGYADLPEGIHADFALRCKGDSMAPMLEDGDLVLIRQQPDVEDGQIAAVNVHGETTLKHVYHQEGGIVLVADNPKFKPIYVPLDSDEEVLIHGLAVGYTRLFS